MQVRALRNLTYNRVRYNRGEAFDVEPRYGKALILAKTAEEVPDEPAPPVDDNKSMKVETPRPRRKKDEENQPDTSESRRRYRRRDMQAEDDDT